MDTLFQDVTDHRDPAHIACPLPTVMTTELLMFLLRLPLNRLHWFGLGNSVKMAPAPAMPTPRFAATA